MTTDVRTAPSRRRAPNRVTNATAVRPPIARSVMVCVVVSGSSAFPVARAVAASATDADAATHAAPVSEGVSRRVASAPRKYALNITEEASARTIPVVEMSIPPPEPTTIAVPARAATSEPPTSHPGMPRPSSIDPMVTTTGYVKNSSVTAVAVPSRSAAKKNPASTA
jgi:hypothetical protein